MPLPARLIGSACFGLLLIGMQSAALAFGTLEESQQTPISAQFKALDKNHDGFLSHGEAAHDADIGPEFKDADLNRDGKLSENEFGNLKTAQQQARIQAFLEDSAITARVKAELLKDGGIHGLAISVETHRGQVILSGFVDSEDQVHRAGEIASGIRGVTSVKNSLLLKG